MRAGALLEVEALQMRTPWIKKGAGMPNAASRCAHLGSRRGRVCQTRPPEHVSWEPNRVPVTQGVSHSKALGR